MRSDIRGSTLARRKDPFFIEGKSRPLGSLFRAVMLVRARRW
jgi:hypothetical protein